jgi:hypothetical protein
MSQKTNAIDAAFTGVGLSNPVKRFTSLPGSIIKQVMFPICWISRWDRNGGVSTFIRKWYFGNF